MCWHSTLSYHCLVEENHPEASVDDRLQLLCHELCLPIDFTLQRRINKLCYLDLLALDLVLSVEFAKISNTYLLCRKLLLEQLSSMFKWEANPSLEGLLTGEELNMPLIQLRLLIRLLVPKPECFSGLRLKGIFIFGKGLQVCDWY